MNKYDTWNFGLPQIRRRIFIVGVRDHVRGVFHMPEPPNLQPPPLSQFLSNDRCPEQTLPPRSGRSARKTCKKALLGISRSGHDPLHETWVIDIDASKDFVSIGHETWPTLVHSRPYGYFLFCMCNV